MSGFVNKMKKKWKQLWLKPIRVFCFHQVSDEFEPDTMWECDWMQTDLFKRNILALKKKYIFISLTEVSNHLAQDRFRLKRYAALTADDGWASLTNILPWLVEQGIPITLFVNPLYMDGVHYQERETEKLLTWDEVAGSVEQYAPYVTVASHGWSHKDCVKMAMDEFGENVEQAEKAILGMKGKIPYYAFTYGRRKAEQVAFLKDRSLIPVYIDGRVNILDASCLHRELLDEGTLR